MTAAATRHPGCRPLRVHDASLDISFPALVLYPTHVPSSPTAFGPYSMDVSPDAPPAPGRFPLVLVSHGNGGSHLLYRALCTHLAQQGFVVAALEHPGNNRNDNRLQHTHQNLEDRPRHASLCIDAVLAMPGLGAQVLAGQVAVVGHSIGGYTALALAGGKPWSKEGQAVHVVADARVRALVLLAPATPWFLAPQTLLEVRVPILMLIGEQDALTPRWHADLVLDGVADRKQVVCRTVPNAGHFSFLSPFPPALTSPSFPPSTDPAGFDRAAFHEELPPEVCAFLRRHLHTEGAPA